MAKKPAAKKRNASERRYDDILYEVKDQVAWVTINRPRVMNAFREQTLDELIDALKSTRDDPSIACAVVTGTGDKAFSAGGDIKEQVADDKRYTREERDRMGNPRRALEISGLDRHFEVRETLEDALDSSP